MSKEETNSKAKHIYLFHGENSYESVKQLNFWRDQFIKKYGNESLENIDGKKMNPLQFNTNIEAIPLFSEKRMMIVKNVFSKGKKETLQSLAKNLKKSADECLIVFYEEGSADKRLSLYKKIKAIGEVKYFPALEPRILSKWILDESKSLKIEIDFPNAKYLSEVVGANLWNLSKELQKLKTLANGQKISRKMIDDICIPCITSSVFKLTDSISQKNLKESLKVLEILSDSGEDLIRIFFMIVRHFRILLQVHEMINKGDNAHSITKKLKQHPFVIQKTSQQSRNFSQAKLEEIYQELLELDRKSKTGIIKSYGRDNRELMLAIEQLIINCCK
jgi:DNA polymerase III subunit delta